MSKEYKVPKGDAKWQVLRGPSPGVRPARAEVKVKSVMTKASKAGQKKRKARGVTGMFPPQLDVDPVYMRVFRYRNTSATQKQITVANMFGILGNVVSVTNTTVIGIASAVRLKKITIWPAIGSPTFANVDWTNSSTTGQSKERQIIDTVPTGVVSEPGPVVYTVPSYGSGDNTLLCGWINTNASSSTKLFDIICTVGSIIDVQVLWQSVNEIAGLQQGISSGSLGSFGFFPLDGTGGVYTPLGVPIL